jgi:hypothetical protein
VACRFSGAAGAGDTFKRQPYPVISDFAADTPCPSDNAAGWYLCGFAGVVIVFTLGGEGLHANTDKGFAQGFEPLHRDQ